MTGVPSHHDTVPGFTSRICRMYSATLSCPDAVGPHSVTTSSIFSGRAVVWYPGCYGCPSLQNQGLELQKTEVQILPLLLTYLGDPRQNRQTCCGAQSPISMAEGNREDVCRAGFSCWPRGGELQPSLGIDFASIVPYGGASSAC